MDTALVVLAAGLGTRFQDGVKQLKPIGPCGESIMDYSVHDAILAGFNRILFVLRRGIESEFRSGIGRQLESVCGRQGVAVDYVFQRIDDLPEGFSAPPGRVKPWGTAQAIAACADKLQTPFAVINADDYYGPAAFHMTHEFLVTRAAPDRYCMVGYTLKNTLSDHGSVTRGICRVDSAGMLEAITETYCVHRTPTGAAARDVPLDPEACVSMNLFGMPQQAPALLREGFADFLAAGPGLTDEYILPAAIHRFLSGGRITVEVLRTQEQWIGMTFREDERGVSDFFCDCVQHGSYHAPLFEDL